MRTKKIDYHPLLAGHNEHTQDHPSDRRQQYSYPSAYDSKDSYTTRSYSSLTEIKNVITNRPCNADTMAAIEEARSGVELPTVDTSNYEAFVKSILQ